MIQYQGRKLLYEVEGVQDWIEDNIDLQSIYSHAPHGASIRPTVPYPDHPPIKINQLYWPTGAQRWGIFYGLARQKDLLGIYGLPPRGGAAIDRLTLGISDADQNTYQIDVDGMTLLPPVSIDFVPPGKRSQADGLYIIPIVDQRYFWQWQSTGDLTITSGTTWASLFGTIATAINAVLALSPIHTFYLTPSIEDLTRDYGNAAAMLDAMSHSVGHRIVMELNGIVKSQTFFVADDPISQNLASGWKGVSGGAKSVHLDAANELIRDGAFHYTVVPDAVRISFPRLCENAPETLDDRYAYTFGVLGTVPIATSPEEGPWALPPTIWQGSEVPLTAAAGSTQKPILSTAGANFLPFPAPELLANNTDLSNLAARIAWDFYRGLVWQYDLTFAGIVPWRPSAYDDFVVWSVGTLRNQAEGTGRVALTTRASSRGFNCEADYLVHQAAPKMRQVRWGKCFGKSKDASGGVPCAHVTVWPCDDCEGANADGTNPHTVLLPVPAGRTHSLKNGDVIAYAASEGTGFCAWVCVSDYLITDVGDQGLGPIFWGKAKENWYHGAAGYCDHVNVERVENCNGDNPTGETFTLHLPQTGQQDPNVNTDEVLGFSYAYDGSYVAVTDYLDDKIGTGKFFLQIKSQIPPGWELQEGTWLDLNGRFPRATNSDASLGLTGGTVSHNHDPHDPDFTDVAYGTGNIGITYETGYTHHAYTGITVDYHPGTELADHYHAIQVETRSLGEDVIGGTPTLVVVVPVDLEWCSTGPMNADCSQYTWLMTPELYHTVTDPGHYHDTEGYGHTHTLDLDDHYHSTYHLYHSTEDHTPPYRYVFIIKRIDNSSGTSAPLS